MSGTCSRREFLTACGAVGAAAAVPTTEATETLQPSVASAGEISLAGQASMAAFDARFQQQQPQMQQTVRAVEDIGLDPSGGTPITDQLVSAVSSMSNARIVFPTDGQFALSGQTTLRPDGPIEIVGNGCSFVIPPDTETKSLVCLLPSGSIVRDIVIDQSASGALQEFSVQTEGMVRVDNVTIKGYAPATVSGSDNGGVDSMFSPIAATESATIRATNFRATGGTAAGTHNDDDLPKSSPENRLGSPMGVWVGRSTKGTIQMVKPKLRGWSNGIYGGRTKGRVQVLGGTFVNNFNAQTRLGGGSVVDGASMLLDDRQWSDKGPFKIGHQGVYAARVDSKNGIQSKPLRFKNVEIQAKSMRGGAAVIEFEDVSAPGKFDNCRIMNHLDRPVIRALPPAGGTPQNVMVDRSLIGGSSPAPVMQIQDRPQSRIQQSCITIPNAGRGDIQGAQIGQGVSFGQCKGTGLRAPQKVGSAGNVSSLPAPTYNGSASVGRSSRPNQNNWIAKIGAGMMRVMALGLLFVCSLFGIFVVVVSRLVGGSD